MAKKGPPPKDPSQKVRRNKDAQDVRIITTVPIPQPELHEIAGFKNPLMGREWSPQSLRLWQHLGEFAPLDTLQEAQWDLLARAVMLDDSVIQGNSKNAPEARLQLAKFGIAPDDVAKHRIQFAEADKADTERNERAVQSSRDRRGPLTAG